MRFPVRFFLALSLLLMSTGLLPSDARSQSPPDLAGTWRGDIEAPAQQIGVVFRLKNGDDGALTATLDVPAQGANGIPFSEVRHAGDSLRLEAGSIGVVVEGAVAEGGERIDATWRQGGGAYPLVLTKGDGPAEGTPRPAAADRRQPSEPDVSGRWQGRLGPPLGLRIVFNIEEADDGTLTATAESPDQGGEPFPVSAVALEDDSLRLEVATVGATFAGRVSGDTVEGTFRQGGVAVPLTLARGEASALRRPQEPQPPFPYESEDVRFVGGGHGESVTLAGTLTLPQGEGPHPAVVLVSGSGPQDRNEEIMGHKPFLVLADYLTRRGVAVLRYDERGVAESEGDFSQATTHTFAGDARAALAYLRSREDLSLGKLGIVGHSEGGLVAPMVAAHHAGAVDFIVLLAGPGVPGDELLARQNALLFERSGMSAEGAAAYEQRMKAALERLDTTPPAEPLPDSVRAALRADFRAAVEAMTPADRAVYGAPNADALDRVLNRLAQQLSAPWMRSFLASNPRPALREANVPILALLGEKDFQVPPEQNVPALREALAENPDATVKVFEDLNHLFQHAETGLPTEYGQIEETFAPEALALISDWIAERTRAGAE